MTVSTAIASRLDRLEQALDTGGPGCLVCCARPPVTGPWTTEREPARCPACGVPWTRWTFTLRLGPPLELLDTDA